MGQRALRRYLLRAALRMCPDGPSAGCLDPGPAPPIRAIARTDISTLSLPSHNGRRVSAFDLVRRLLVRFVRHDFQAFVTAKQSILPSHGEAAACTTARPWLPDPRLFRFSGRQSRASTPRLPFLGMCRLQRSDMVTAVAQVE